jgi:hypothetical protein
VRLVRPFGYPGRIDEGEHVWLTLWGIPKAAVVLNEQALDLDAVFFESEVTALLTARNRLALTLVAGRPATPVWDEVALEIRRDAFLRAAAWRLGPGEVEVKGMVVGPAGLGLELYALVDGHNVHYEPIAAGDCFCFVLRDIDTAGHTVRLDLVNVATSWYVLDVPIPAAGA